MMGRVHQPHPAMNAETHGEKIYRENQPDRYRRHLESSLALIKSVASSPDAHIIDVGGGESTLVDDLIAANYRNITVLDISQTAVGVTKKRLGPVAELVRWLVVDITSADLPPGAYDVWHDRAVFHFTDIAPAARGLHSPGHSRGETGRPCVGQHIWAGRAYPVQRSRRCPLRFRIAARRVRRTL